MKRINENIKKYVKKDVENENVDEVADEKVTGSKKKGHQKRAAEKMAVAGALSLAMMIGVSWMFPPHFYADAAAGITGMFGEESIADTNNGANGGSDGTFEDSAGKEIKVVDLRGVGALGDITKHEDNAGAGQSDPVEGEPSDEEALAEDAFEPAEEASGEFAGEPYDAEVLDEPVLLEPAAEPGYVVEEVPFVEETPVANPMAYVVNEPEGGVDGAVAGAKYGSGIVFDANGCRIDGNGNVLASHAEVMSELYGTSIPNKMTSEESKRAREIFESYNDYREMNGLARVTWSEDCANMAYQSCLGCSARFDRSKEKAGMQHRLGIPSAFQMDVSDILQYTTHDAGAIEVVSEWHRSNGHRRMMLCPSTQVAGVAVYHDTVHRVWFEVIVYDFASNNQAAE